MNVLLKKTGPSQTPRTLIIKIKTWKKGDTLTLSVSRKPHALIAR
jgi:hypothetical protein